MPVCVINMIVDHYEKGSSMNISEFEKMVRRGEARDSKLAEAFLTMEIASNLDINKAVEMLLEHRPIILNCTLLQIDSMT